MDNAVTQTIAQSANGLGLQTLLGMIHRPIADARAPKVRCRTCQVMTLLLFTAQIAALCKMVCAGLTIAQYASGHGQPIPQLQNHGTMILTESAGVKSRTEVQIQSMKLSTNTQTNAQFQDSLSAQTAAPVSILGRLRTL